MNLPLFLPGMQNFIVVCLAFLAGMAIAVFLLKYKFKKSAVRKCLIVFVLAIVGVMLVYILFYTGSNIIGRFQVETQLTKMRAQGIPLDKDAILPKMPEKDSDNGAHFYKAAFEIMKGSSTHSTLLDMIAEQPGYDITEWNDQARRSAAQFLKTQDVELILKLFRQGAERPYCVYEREYRGFETLLPELQSQRQLFRLISMKSSSDGVDGNPDSGYALILDGFRNVKQLEHEPFIISQLVNIACTSLNIDAMNALLFRYGIDRQNAEQLLSELNKIDFKIVMTNVRSGEILMGRELFERIIHGNKLGFIEKALLMKDFNLYTPPYPKDGEFMRKPIFLLSSLLCSDMGKKMIMANFRFYPLVCPFLYQDYVCYLKQEAKIRTLYSKPYWVVEKETEEVSNEISNTPICYLVSIFLLSPYTSYNRIRAANIESEIDAAKLTLALHIYKNQHGVFPDRLESLAPEILKEIPVDPVSGKPFEYSKTGNTFTISSVWLKEKAEIYRKNRSKHNSGK